VDSGQAALGPPARSCTLSGGCTRDSWLRRRRRHHELEGPRTSEGTKTTAQAQEAEHGAQVFSSAGCGSCHAFKAAGSKGTTGPDLDEYLEPDDNQAGIEEMIVDPNAEIAEGYKADVMPKTFGESLSPKEVKQLVAFLYENSPASETSTGEQGEREEEGK
jgi:mono/diheme cytochrome c family protein